MRNSWNWGIGVLNGADSLSSQRSVTELIPLLTSSRSSSCFHSYEVTAGPDVGVQKRNIFKELVLALLAAVFLGFGTLFLLLWSGVYV
jgi:hypothetical protein